MVEKSRPNRFTEVLGEDVDNAFKKLASEVLKDGTLTLKDKSIIGLACAVAVNCDSCVKAHKKQALKAGAREGEIMEAAAVAGLVRMGSGFNTAYAIIDECEPRKTIHFKANDDLLKETQRRNEDKPIPRKPDGYVTTMAGKNDYNKNKE
ncbi:MAG: carboxymuconolactone decarboxylase family protein [Methanobacterium sp.]|jgi:AhpD family alkylhydroperoxidase|nr:carboxymuconolactone decarboxylase family protein [Methanobacterium sp.]